MPDIHNISAAPHESAAAVAVAAHPNAPQPPGFWRWAARAFLILWWLFVIALATGIATYAGNHSGPAIISLLPSLLAWARGQSRAIQISLALGALLVLAAMAWLTYLAWRQRQRQTFDAAQAVVEQQTAAFEGALDRGMTPRLGEIQGGVEQAVAQGKTIQDQNDTLRDQGARIEERVAATQTAVESLHQEIGDLARRTERGPVTRRVFISSTYVDLHAYRARLHADLEGMYQLPVDMVNFEAGGSDPTTVSRAEVGASDLFVIVVAWRYGYIPDGEAKSITHQEYDEARRLGLPVFVFLADPGTERDDGPAALFPAALRDLEHAHQLTDFRALLANPDRHTFVTFTTMDDLSSKVVKALARYLLRHAGAAALSGQPDAAGRIVALAEMPRHGALVGRTDLLPRLRQRLVAGDDVGVFALGGIGGVGKTALAVAAVTDLAADDQTFPGGVAWIPCTDQTGESGLNTLVERVALYLRLGSVLSEPDPLARRQMLAAALATRPRTLLALDNVEPGLDAEAMLAIFSAPGHTTLLLTARDRIAQGYLRTIDVSPLPPADAATLFVRRLAQDTFDARPTNAERPEIAPLVEAVEHLPLAIELLAAYAARQNTPLARLRAELAAEGITAAAFRTDPKRSLMKTFDRSWRVLAPRQQALFAGLSLLAGASFPREAALALALAAAAKMSAGDNPNASDVAPDPEADLDALVRARLVEPLEGGRLRQHQMLREYAVHQLADPAVVPPEVAFALRDAALAYWLAYAEAHPSLGGMNALEAEDEGLMGAVVLAHAHQQHETLLALAHALRMYWDVRARVASERMVYPWALEAAHAIPDETEERWALHENALVDHRAGLVDSAREQYQLALDLARRNSDPRAEQAALHGLAVLLADTGHPDEAREQFALALDLARRIGDPRAEQAELHELAVRTAQAGHPDEAREQYQEALELARRIGDPRAEQAELHGLAVRTAQAGHPDEARQLYQEALELARRNRDPRAERAELHGLAVLLADTGHPDEAREQYQLALDLARRLGDPRAIATELMNFGVFIGQRDELARGRAMIQEALEICTELGAVYETGTCHQFLAWLDEQADNRAGMVAHYREALRLFTQVHSPDAAQVRAELRALGEDV